MICELFVHIFTQFPLSLPVTKASHFGKVVMVTPYSAIRGNFFGENLKRKSQWPLTSQYLIISAVFFREYLKRKSPLLFLYFCPNFLIPLTHIFGEVTLSVCLYITIQYSCINLFSWIRLFIIIFIFV